MKVKLLVTIFLVGMSITAHAQLKKGFKTGLNFAQIKGPSETDAAGNALESWDTYTGFHIGITLAKPITDNFGVRAEVLYNKKGGQYTFDAPTAGTSYRFFQTPTGNVFTTSEKSKVVISVNNSYIDVPVMAYAKWRNFEVSGGLSMGFLINSTGQGSLTYTGKTNPPQSVSTGELIYNLDYNYRKDKPGGFTEEGGTIPVKINAQNLDFPQNIGAYYEHTVDNGNLYKTMDFGAVAGVSYYLSRALYANVRLQYGLSDITNDKADLSRKPGENNAPVFNADKDKNFVITASVGFSF